MYVLNYWKGCLTAFNLYLFFLVGHYLWGFFFPSLSLYYSSQWFSVCGPKTSSISISTVESLSEIHILRPYPRLLNQKLLVHAKTWEPIWFLVSAYLLKAFFLTFMEFTKSLFFSPCFPRTLIDLFVSVQSTLSHYYVQSI